jgi:hypothetical protein
MNRQVALDNKQSQGLRGVLERTFEQTVGYENGRHLELTGAGPSRRR